MLGTKQSSQLALAGLLRQQSSSTEEATDSTASAMRLASIAALGTRLSTEVDVGPGSSWSPRKQQEGEVLEGDTAVGFTSYTVLLVM